MARSHEDEEAPRITIQCDDLFFILFFGEVTPRAVSGELSPSLLPVHSLPLKPQRTQWVCRECKLNKALRIYILEVRKYLLQEQILTLCIVQKAPRTGKRQIWCLAHLCPPPLAVPLALKGRTCNFSLWLQALMSLHPGMYLQPHMLPLHPQRCFIRLPNGSHGFYADCFTFLKDGLFNDLAQIAPAMHDYEILAKLRGLCFCDPKLGCYFDISKIIAQIHVHVFFIISGLLTYSRVHCLACGRHIVNDYNHDNTVTSRI